MEITFLSVAKEQEKNDHIGLDWIGKQEIE